MFCLTVYRYTNHISCFAVNIQLFLVFICKLIDIYACSSFYIHNYYKKLMLSIINAVITGRYFNKYLSVKKARHSLLLSTSSAPKAK